ncbi:acetolactate synthase small subunit [Buchnera aphidicola (Mollitrichosiphum nigrofasciatum)]|uniref:acetolactate synthase small subunit n=1 Tax=Buchnera aphidicola TaxID=9 RepID=UPI0031B831F3
MGKILSILLENEFGALSRVIGLFAQRGYNIDSLTVAPTEDHTLSLVTIKTISNEKCFEQIKKQLYKLIDVLKVNQIKSKKHIKIETMLIKTKKITTKKKNLLKIIKKKIKFDFIYQSEKISIIQITNIHTILKRFLNKINKIIKIIKISRSGVISISKKSF